MPPRPRFSVKAIPSRAEDVGRSLDTVQRAAEEDAAWTQLLLMMGRLQAEIGELKVQVGDLAETVRTLRDEAQQRKGMLWVAGAAWAAVVALAGIFWPDIKSYARGGK